MASMDRRLSRRRGLLSSRLPRRGEQESRFAISAGGGGEDEAGRVGLRDCRCYAPDDAVPPTAMDLSQHQLHSHVQPDWGTAWDVAGGILNAGLGVASGFLRGNDILSGDCRPKLGPNSPTTSATPSASTPTPDPSPTPPAARP
jgi:hypothetical protein